MKPILSVSLLSWMFLFGSSHASADVRPKYQSQIKQKFVWHTHFDTASNLARAQNKKLFILFTGSDWCPPCKEFKKKILDKNTFKKEAVKEYVFLVCDFPRFKKMNSVSAAHNEKLSERYKVRSFPTVILAQDNGKEEKRLEGNSKASVVDYLKLL